jgi:N utilization substance protein A
MDLKTLTSAVMEIAEDRGIPQEKVIKIIADAIASAYKKEYGEKRQKIIAKLNPKTGEIKFWQVKQVVTEDMILSEEEKPAFAKATAGEEKIRFNPERHIMLGEAKKIDSKIKKEDELKIPLETKEDFGRIATQTAKQVILQKIKEAEREEILKEYKSKEGEIVSGIVQRVESESIFFDIGKTSGILPRSEQIPGEFYRPGQRLKLYILKVEESAKGPVIFLSRAYPKLISKLFELEAPEVSAKQVVIKSIAREPGSRTKLAVTANEEGIDPIGSMVGQRGTRVLAVINELGGEKIDIIEWSDKVEEYITNSLSPAKVAEVKIMPKNKAVALVPEDQLSLAIGKKGQNVRLAAKLTGWKIDVRSLEQAKKEEEPAFAKAASFAEVVSATEAESASKPVSTAAPAGKEEKKKAKEKRVKAKRTSSVESKTRWSKR